MNVCNKMALESTLWRIVGNFFSDFRVESGDNLQIVLENRREAYQFCFVDSFYASMYSRLSAKRPTSSSFCLSCPSLNTKLIKIPIETCVFWVFYSNCKTLRVLRVLKRTQPKSKCYNSWRNSTTDKQNIDFSPIRNREK